MVAPWLNDPAVVPYTKIDFVAVGIINSAANQMHAALLYKGEDDSFRALHFCWHQSWADEPAPPGYHWTQPAIRRSVARSLAAFCRFVASQRTLQKVPFAFDLNASAIFDEETGRLLGPAGQGLTCATFVMTMFASVGRGIRLVLQSSWPRRACDKRWFARIVRALEADHPAHAKALKAQPDAVRYRPEEVVAAAAQRVRPVPFAIAIKDGRRVLQAMGLAHISCWHDEASGAAVERPKRSPLPVVSD